MSHFFLLTLFYINFGFLAWSTGFLTADDLIILHAGCLTFHAINHNKAMSNGTKIRNIITNTEKAIDFIFSRITCSLLFFFVK
jgi:hypothetical protein